MGVFRFEFIGNDLAIDFTNTINTRGGSLEERLNTYADLVHWGAQAGLYTARIRTHLLMSATRSPRAGAAVLRRALSLRESLYRLFAAEAGAVDRRSEDLDVLNTELQRALANTRMVRTSGEYRWVWQQKPRLDQILWPVARAAAELLAIAADQRRVGVCGNETCRWLFLDETRNRSRRWCDTMVCGNRLRARRHYAKVRARQRRRAQPGVRVR